MIIAEAPADRSIIADQLIAQARLATKVTAELISKSNQCATAVSLFMGKTKAAPRRAARTKVHDPNALLTMNQVATRFNSTPDQVRGFVDDGTLRYINVGRGKKRPRYRFKPSDVEEFEAARTTQGQPCRSTPRRNTKAFTNSTSKSTIIGFTALRAARLAAKPKNSKR